MDENKNMMDKEEKSLEIDLVEDIESLASEKKNETKEEKPKADKKIIKISLRTIVVVVVVIAVLILAYIFKGLLVAATVNGSPIGRLTVIEKLEKASGQTLLDSLIEQKLITDEAAARNIEVTNEEVADEIKKIEDQISAQGGNLEDTLEQQGMTRQDLEEQILLQKQLEKMLSDKIEVTDDDVANYISTYKLDIPEEQQATAYEQIKAQIKNQKLSQEFDTFLGELKDKADIKYFVKY